MTSFVMNKLPLREFGTTELSSKLDSLFLCLKCYKWLVRLVRDTWVDDDIDVGVSSFNLFLGNFEISSSLFKSGFG